MASPSAASTTASAGSASSRTLDRGCHSTHTSASAASRPSIQGGPTVWRGA